MEESSNSINFIINAVIAGPETYPISEDPNIIRKILLELANYVRSLEKQVYRWRQAATQNGLSTIALNSDDSSDGDDSESALPKSDSIDGIDEALRAMALRSDSKTYRHIGKSSSMMMMKRAALVKEELLGRRIHVDPSVSARRMEFWTLYPVSFSIHCDVVLLNICNWLVAMQSGHTERITVDLS